jgi:hypothetical protein
MSEMSSESVTKRDGSSLVVASAVRFSVIMHSCLFCNPIPIPPDAEQYVIYSTIAELARSKAGAAAVAAQYDRQAALALARCEKFYIDYVPNTMDRTGAIEPDFAARTQILGTPRIT